MAAPAATAAGTVPGTTGQKYSYANIMWLWIRNGGAAWLAPIMAAIAMAESGGITNRLNPKAPDYSVGLWQINYFGANNAPRTKAYGTPAQLAQSPDAQAKAAIDISGGSAFAHTSKNTILQNLYNNWSTYASGAYKSFLQSGVTPTNPKTGQPGVTPIGPSVGGVAGSIANALIPDWINKHNTVRFGQGFMGFGLIVLGIVILGREGARSVPAATVTAAGGLVASGARETSGAAQMAGRRVQGKSTGHKSRQGRVSTGGNERMTLREPPRAKPKGAMSDDLPF